MKHVTKYDEEHLARNPFPELHRPPDEILASDKPEADPKKHRNLKKTNNDEGQTVPKLDPKQEPLIIEDARRQASPESDIEVYLENEERVTEEVKDGDADTVESVHSDSTQEKDPKPESVKAEEISPNSTLKDEVQPDMSRKPTDQVGLCLSF